MEAFYYRSLNCAEQYAYRQIDRAIGRRLPMVSLDTSVSVDRLREISRCVTLDHPEYFWSSGAVKALPGTGRRVLALENLVFPQDYDFLDQQILKTMEAVCNTVGRSGDRNAVLGLYDWFCGNVCYDESPGAGENIANQTISSVFMDGKSLCMGLAKAFDLLLRLCGLEGTIALGRLFGEEDSRHAWNLVRVDGVYLHADVTMAYPCFRERWQQYSGSDEPCLLLPGDSIRATHRLAGPVSYQTLGV